MTSSRRLFIDIETSSTTDLSKAGVYRYAESEDFQILLFAFSFDGDPVEVIDMKHFEAMPDFLIEALLDPDVIKVAHNAAFERICLSRYFQDLGMLDEHEFLDPGDWQCSMVHAATLGLPLSLDQLSQVLNLERPKLKEGRALIKMFCNGPVENEDPEKWQLFKEYNKRDVEAEIEIEYRLIKFPVRASIWTEYQLDQKINDAGVLVDINLATNALEISETAKESLIKRLQEMTGLENPNSPSQMKEWLLQQNLPTDTLNQKAMKALMEKASPKVREVLALRNQLAMASVKKYEAMLNSACSDGRIRGMFQFYGAIRTGRYSGRIVQLQNLPRNKMPDLKEARSLVADKNIQALEMLYDDIPDTLSQLIRTALIAPDGKDFIVADFSAIEARVLSWLAEEEWRQTVFKENGDIYCETASRMFKVPVVKHGVNGDLRQKGKQAELACIAKGELVLTDKGLVPIEDVRLDHRLWDGENWVTHEGVIEKGIGEVIKYEGLRATKDHVVWIKGSQKPIQFGKAASSGTHLIQTGNGRHPIRLGDNHLSTKALEPEVESLLCPNKVQRMRKYPMARSQSITKRKVKRMPGLFAKTEDPNLARKAINRSQKPMRERKRPRIQKLWCSRDQISFCICDRSRTVSHVFISAAFTTSGNRSNRYKWKLRAGKHSICFSRAKSSKQAQHRLKRVQARVLALFPKCGSQKTRPRIYPRTNHQTSRGLCKTKMQGMETDLSKTRLYDIRNAGPHHRFTVSNKLVHNCGYGGSVGAMKAMGALDFGMKEEELKPLVDSWREANPKIVKYWWAVDAAIKKAIRTKQPVFLKNLVFSYSSGILFIQLPSGRSLAYPKPKIESNEYGTESVTYMGLGLNKKWERLESYGPKFVENITQAISRDLLMNAMSNCRNYKIVAHVHDEIIVEAEPDLSVETVCNRMCKLPSWANGLVLNAEGYRTPFYCKD